MLKKLGYVAIGLFLFLAGMFFGHLTSPDSYTVSKVGQAQTAYGDLQQRFDQLCPAFLSDQAKLETRLAPGEKLDTYNCTTSTLP